MLQSVQRRIAAATSSGLSSSARWPAPDIVATSVRPVIARGEAVGVAARHDAVFGAPDQQGRRLDQRQPLFEPGVAERPEGAGRRLGGAGLLDRPFRRIRAFGRGLELVPALRIGAQQRRHLGRTLRPRVGRRLLVVEQAPRRDQGEPTHGLRPNRRDLGDERAADRTAGKIGAVETGLLQQLPDRQNPIEMAVEHGMPAIAARGSRQRGHDNRALTRQRVEKRDPAWQPAKAGQKAKLRAFAFLPHPSGKPVDVDRDCPRLAHALLPPATRVVNPDARAIGGQAARLARSDAVAPPLDRAAGAMVIVFGTKHE